MVRTSLKQLLLFHTIHHKRYIAGFAAVLVGTGMITTVLCTRVHMLAAAVISFFYSAILYPVVAHWLWIDHGWMQQTRTVTVNNYAGGLAVHTTASTVASVGAILLGRRLLRLSDISEISIIGVEVSRNTVAGYMFVIIGLIVFSLPTPEEEFRLKYNNFDGVLFTNNVLGLSAAGLITILLDISINCRKTITYWPLLKYLQASIAGVIALSCGVDIFSPIASFGVGLFTGLVFFFTSTAIHHSFIEDNCNIIASSFISSFLASLLSQVVSKNDALQAIIWQIFSHLIICVFSFVSAMLLLLLFYVSNRLKSKSELVNHERSRVAYRRNTRASYRNLFSLSKGAGYVEPGTSKVNIDNKFSTEVVGDRIVKQEASDENSTVTDWGETSVTPVSSTDNTSNISRRSSKKYINLQASSSRIGRFRSLQKI